MSKQVPKPVSKLRPLRVAIVGSGPAGMYAASHLFGSPVGTWLNGRMAHLTDRAFEIDMIDKLPTPWGLVRGGVAPDHPEKKQITRTFERIAQRPEFRFFGNLEVGSDLAVGDLQRWYDAVLFAHGADGDRTLSIKGEDLLGCASAREFVAWYNGHPDASQLEFDLSGDRVVVVGNGNVALDVARILTRSVDELATTDIAEHALRVLRKSCIQEVVLLGRRGPLQAAFNSPELEELGTLNGVDILVEGVLPEIESAISQDASFVDRRKLELLHEFSARPMTPGNRRIILRFEESALSISGTNRIRSVVVGKNRMIPGPSGQPVAEPTGESYDLQAGLVLRAVGYAGTELVGLPFDEARCIIPNRDGRVTKDDQTQQGLYVAGWSKRGPTGVIGTNRKCALDTVRALIEDADNGAIGTSESILSPTEVAERLRACKSKVTDFHDWKIIDRAEQKAGVLSGRPRVKLVTRVNLLAATDEMEKPELPSKSEPIDVIVIGSGLGGLSTAAALAARGKSVLVLEQHEIIGGCSQTFRRKGQFEFDTGVHYLSECEPGSDGMLATTLRGLGIEDRVEWSKMDDNGMDTVQFPNHEFRVATSWEGYKQNLIDCFPADADGLAKCLDGLRAIGESGYRTNDIPHSMGILLRYLKRPSDVMKVATGFLSITDYLGRFKIGIEAQAALMHSVFLHNTPPVKTPVLLVALLCQSYFKSGAYFPSRGGQSIGASLLEVIQAYGGSVRTKARVQSIDVEAGRVKGVTLTDGESIRADVVVSNADAHRTFQDLIDPQHLSRRARSKVEKLRRPHSIFSTYIGADIDLSRTRPATNYILNDRYDMQTTFDIQDRGGWDPKGWLAISSPTLKNKGINHYGPRGSTSIELFTTVPAEYSFWGGGDPMAGTAYKLSAQYQERKQEVEDVLVERTLKALPELRGHIVHQESATPLSHERFTLSRMPYGPENARDQIGLFGRLSAKTEIAGLFLAGASTSYMYGVMFTMRGGLGTASAILGERDLYEEFQKGRVIVDPAVLPKRGNDWDPFTVSRGLSQPDDNSKPEEATA